MAETGMERFLHSVWGRAIARVLVWALILQSWPLWELSHAYPLSGAKLERAFEQLGEFFSFPAAQAAPPVAAAGPDQTLEKNQPLSRELLLDGSGSFDPDGDPLSHQWYGPFGSVSSARPVVEVPEGGYTVTLRVLDGLSGAAVDTARLEILPCFLLSETRSKAGKVQLTWPSQAGVSRYDIYRASEADPSNFVKIGDTPASVATYLDDTVANEITYLYLVGAIFPGAACYSDVLSAHPTTSRRPGNYPPVIYSPPITHGTVGITYSYDVNATDPNGDALSYSLIQQPAGMAIDPNTGEISWSPAAAGLFDVTVAVSDGRGGSATQTFVVTVAELPAANRAPLADAGPDQTVFVSETVTLDGSASSDADGDPLTYSWSFSSVPSGSAAVLSDPTAVMPTFTVDLPGDYVAELIVNDGTVDSIADTVTVTTLNSPPVAKAGPDQTVFVTETVTLDGSGSTDVDGDPLSYTWSFVSRPAGSAAMLSDPTAAMPTFVADLPGAYVAKLIVNDGSVDSAPATVTIITVNSAPEADAGADQTVFVSDTVTLDGSRSSDVDGDSLTFSWSLQSVPPGSTAVLSDPTAVNPTFGVDLPGLYVAQLIVNDGTVDSAPDTVRITTQNSRPVANAGSDQTVLVGETVTLDGSGSSDVDGDSLTYSWSLESVPTGSTAVLSDPTAVKPTFAVDLPGEYVAQLIVNDGTLDSDPDTVRITTDNSTPVADAGPDQTVFVGETVTLDGSGSSDVDGDALTFSWSLQSVPAGSAAVLSDPTAVKPNFDVDLPGEYVAQLIVNDGTVDSAPDTVTITTENSPPMADAGPDQTVFVGETVTLDGSGSSDVDGDALTFSWSLQSSPAGSTAVLSDPTAVNPSFTVDLPGEYVAQLIVNDGTVDSVPDTVTITTENSPPVADAGLDQSISVGDTVILDGSGSSDADFDPLTYSWSFTSRPAGSSAGLSDSTAVSPSFVADRVGTYVAQLIVNDGTVDSVPDTVTIDATNDAPSITSTPELTATVGQLYSYDVEATDPNAGDTLSFSLDVAPTGMTIDSGTGLVQWTPPSAGDQAVTVRVTDSGGLFDTQNFTIAATSANQPPTITSTPVTTATVEQPYSYDVEATDPDAGDTLTFSLDVASTGMTIDSTTGLIEWTPTAAQTGDNAVTVRVTDNGGLFDTQSFTVTVAVAPVVGDLIRPEVTLSVAPPAANVGDSVSITVTATDNVGVVATALLVDGNPMPLDGAGNATFSSPTAGVFTAVATARDAAGNEGQASQEFRFLTTGDTTPPTVALSAPADNAELSLPTDVMGTATDETQLTRYVLEYSVKGRNEFIPFATATTPVTNAVLGKLDPTLLRNGLYDVRLTAEDASGNTASVTRTVQLEGEAKVGNFTISFNDLTIPVAGIPITITRTYDSRLKRKGDFGVGWTLALTDIEVSESGILGEDWNQSRSGGFIPTYFLQATKPHFVTVTFPDGRTDKFNMVVNPSSQQLFPITFATASFSAASGTFSSLTALADNDLFVLPGSLGPSELVDFSSLSLYDPDAYRLTDVQGTVFVINQNTGLQSITEPNGNTISFGPGGIIHSAGKSITFTRDAQGRITAITDPKGNSIQYDYDFYGDLVSVTDQEGNITRFTYNSSHGLVDIVDPRGIVPIRNEYDAEGRLIATTDANGDQIRLTHDFNSRQEVVRDRRGNVTVYQYDDNGNVLSQTDALGNTITFTYDARGNKLSETDPLGNTTAFTYDIRDNILTKTDPLGNTTSFTYNTRNQILTITDRLGNTSTNTYDANGNLLTRVDPLGNTASYTYDAVGNLLSITDNFDNTTINQYDAIGNLIKETDPLGNVTTFTYDSNGNQLTKTTSRTNDSGNTVQITTAHVYNANNRIVQSIDPEGNSNFIEYNVFGKESATIDKNGNRTGFEYDLVGNLTKTIYPDRTIETSLYDAYGNRISFTDRVGRTTQFEFDVQNRPTKVIYPDGSVKSTRYDAAGRTTSVTDENGNETRYEYDAAGNRTKVTDALGNVTQFTYDSNGNQISMTDAKGNTTTFEYDALGRKTKTIFPDGKETATAYDALGRTSSQTDQAGRTTRFEYDALGRLTKVIDALGGETTYGYDELGNKITQTDANGNATSWTYDSLGRMLSRTLPLGMRETFTYDANGNQLSHTDFNGDTTTFAYDSENRLVQKSYPDSTSVAYTYTATGQVETVTDSRGVTRQTYDNRDRLVRVENPDGTFINYAYDAAGNRTGLTMPSSTTTYTFDALNRLATVTDPNSGVTTYTYDAVGNRASVTYPNGTEAKYTYDALNRLTLLENLRSDSSVISSYEYTLGPVGNRVRVVEDTGRTVDYTYDALYRLTGEAITDLVAGNGTIEYTYDPMGNRLIKSVDGLVALNYTYDENDRLLAAGAVTYTYDDNGNMLSKTENSGTTNYSYDFENRLVAATTTSMNTMVYAYDADGLQVSTTVNGDNTKFVVDKNRDFAQVLEERNSAEGLVVFYVYGDDLLSQTRNGLTSYYHYDGLGSTRVLTDINENITDTYIYQAFGELLSSTGNTTNTYLFTGEKFDPNIRFYYLRARYYDHSIGRFISQDPFPGSVFDPKSLHRYLYANADPINNIDPSGLFTLVELSVAISIQLNVNTIRLVYTKRLLKFAISALRITYCVINPGFRQRDAALLTIAGGTLDDAVWDSYLKAQNQISEGFQQLARAISDFYIKFFVDVIVKDLKIGIAATILKIDQQRIFYLSIGLVTKAAALVKLKRIVEKTAKFLDNFGNNNETACRTLWLLELGSTVL